jgi:hypothetical protein
LHGFGNYPVHVRLLIVVAACGSAGRPAPVVGNAARSCTEAAVGLERATRGVRAPETSVADAMRVRCATDAWPAAAIDCFATMHEGDLGRCARRLDDRSREAMFAVIGGDRGRGAITVARARLAGLSIGVADCDAFVAAVTALLDCERVPVEARVELGNETASMWHLPSELSADAHARMSAACAESLAELQARAVGAGC